MPPGSEGVDYSWTRPDPACLAQSGRRFVVRYLGDDDTGENLQPDELNSLRSAGLKVVLIWQTGKSFMLTRDGAECATVALEQANALGMPADRPIYFALDQDPNAMDLAQWMLVINFLRKAASVLGIERVGVYGGKRAIDELVPNEARWGWQTYAWSGGQWSSKAHLQQYLNGQSLCGGLVDFDRSVSPDFGQW